MLRTLLPLRRRFGLSSGLICLLTLLGYFPALAQTAPANDDCAGAVPVAVAAGCILPVNGTVGGATQSLPPTAVCGLGVFMANDVWYRFVAGTPSVYITLAPRFAAVLDVRAGTCTSTGSVYCNTVLSGNGAPVLVPGLTVGQSYFMRVYANGGVPPAGINTTFALCISPGPVTTAPVNDECSGALLVPVQAGGVCATAVSGDNTNATASAGMPAPTCAAYQGADIWFKVTVPAGGALTVQTLVPGAANDLHDTGLSLYAGTCAALAELACDDDSGGGLKSLVSVSGRSPGEVLYVRVWGRGGNTGAVAVCAVVAAVPPNDDCAQAVPLLVSPTCIPTAGSLTAATQSLPTTPGCGATVQGPANDVWYSFVATGPTQTLTFAGGFAAVLNVRAGGCAGSTNVYCAAALNGQPQVVPGLTAGQTYLLRIYGSAATLPPSAQFTICVTPGPPPPANDECAGAIPIPVTTTCATPVSTNLAYATQSLPPTTNCNFNAVANDVWYSFVASGNTQTVTFTGQFPAVLDLRSGSCANSASIFCTTILSGQALTLGGLSRGQTYFLRLYLGNGTLPSTNLPFTLCVTDGLPPPPNDECAGAITVPVSTTCANPVSGTLAYATQSLPRGANCPVGGAANDVWYRFVATGVAQLVEFTSQFTATIDVRVGTCASSSSLSCTTIAAGQPLVLGGLTAGQSYFLRLYAYSNQSFGNGAFTLCVNDGPLPPAPSNDECAGALPLPVVAACTTPVAGSYYGATQSLPPTAGCGFVSVAYDVWYRFVANGTSQTLTVSSVYGTVVDVRAGTCASSASIFCGTTAAGPSLVLTGLTSGQPYLLRLHPNTNTPPLPNGSPFTLCLTAGPPPLGNDECAGAIALPVVLNCANSTNGTVENATQSLPPTGRCGGITTVARDVWFSFVASGPAQLITLNSPFPAVLDVYSPPCAGSASLFCNAVLANSTSGTVVGGLTAGQTYLLRIYVDNALPLSGALSRFSVCVSTPPPGPANDECAGAVPILISASCTSPVHGTVAGASQSLPPPVTCGFVRQALDVWYSFVADGPSQRVTLMPSFNAVFEVRSGTCASSTSLFCSNVLSNNTTSTVVGGLMSGQTYYLRVYADNPFPLLGTAAGFALCLSPGPPPVPANDACAGAVPLPVTATCASPITGTVAGASQSVPATANCSLGGVANDVWYSFVASGSTHILTFTGQFQSVLDVRSGTCANSASLFCATAGTLPATAQFVGGLTAGQTYFLRIYANGPLPVGASAAFTICLTPGPPPPANDDCAGASVVPVQVGTTCAMQTAGSNLTATSSMNAPIPTCAAYQGADIWYQVTVPANGALTVRTLVPTAGNDAGDTGMSIYSGTCGSLTEIGCDDDSGGGAKSLVSLTGRLPGEILYVRVWGVGGGRGLFGVCATTLAPLPNDEPCGAVPLPITGSGGPLQPVASTNVGATTSTQPGIGSPGCAPTATPQDVWFRFTPAPGVSAVTLNFTGSAAGLVRVFTAPNCASGPFTLVACQGLGTSGQGTVSLTGLTPSQTYYVAVSGYNPGDAPGAFSIIGTTVLAACRTASADALLVYPNPSATGQLTLRLPGAGSGSGTLLDAVGRTVRVVVVPAGGGEQALPTAGLPAGVYTLRVVTGGQVLARKVLLE